MDGHLGVRARRERGADRLDLVRRRDRIRGAELQLSGTRTVGRVGQAQPDLGAVERGRRIDVEPRRGEKRVAAAEAHPQHRHLAVAPRHGAQRRDGGAHVVDDRIDVDASRAGERALAARVRARHDLGLGVAPELIGSKDDELARRVAVASPWMTGSSPKMGGNSSSPGRGSAPGGKAWKGGKRQRHRPTRYANGARRLLRERRAPPVPRALRLVHFCEVDPVADTQNSAPCGRRRGRNGWAR